MRAEARRGHRRHVGTTRGEHYQRIRAYNMDGDGAAPGPDAWTVGDLVAPERPARATDVVNTASMHLGTDAAEWSVVRLLTLLAQARRENRARAES